MQISSLIYRTIVSILIFTLTIFTSFAANYYVDSINGSDSNSGSLTAPWQTLSKVSTTAFSPGDVISFACGGSWTGGISVTQSGTTAQPITFTSYGSGAMPSFTNPNYNVLNSNIFQVHGQHIVIQNLYFHDIPGLDATQANANEPKVRTLGAVYIASESGYVTVQNCEAKSVPAAVRCLSQNNLVTENYFHDSNMKVDYYWGPVAIFLNTSNNEASYNVISNFWCTSDAWGADGGAFELDDETLPKNNIKIHHNITFNNQGFLEVVNRGNITSNIQIYYNYSNDTEKFLGLGNAQYWQVYNNTVLRVLPPRGLYDNAVVWFNGGDISNTFKNNIIVTAHSLPGMFLNQGTNADAASQIHSNNIFWSADGSTSNPIGQAAGTGDVIANPNFVDYSNFDVHIQSTSPARGAGVSVGLTTDLDGNSIPRIPDAGVFQYKSTITKASSPTFSPGSNNYTTPQTVTINCSTANAAIYYTTDGTDPRTSTTRSLYKAPLTIASATTVTAYAEAMGFLNSAVGTASFTFSGAGGTGTLTLTNSATAGTTAVNLTALGTSDWRQWGYSGTSSNYDTGTIVSDYSVITSGSTVMSYSNNLTPFSWTNGQPNTSVTGTATGIYASGVNNGFQITLASSSTARIATIYVGGWKSSGQLSASFADGSASPITSAVASNSSGQYFQVYTISYSSSNSSPLTVKWTQTAGIGNVTLNAVAVSPAVSSTGTLSFASTGTAGSNTVNLSTLGTSDWRHWGYSDITSNYDTGAIISDYAVLASGTTVNRYSNNLTPFSWNNGHLTTSATSTTTGIYVSGVNNGFQLTLASSPTVRSATIYVGGWKSSGLLSASFADGSASPITSAVASNSSGQYFQVYTISYSSSNSSPLTVKWTQTADFGSGYGNVTLNAVAVP